MDERASRPSLTQVYQWWWLHDGRWYQEVAQRFGFDAANEINKSALRFLAARVAKGVLKSLDKPIEQMEWPEVVEVFCRGARLMWPGDALDFSYTVTGPGTFQVDIVRNFALDMLQRAGTLDKYDCPCLSLREGWFEGLGLQPLENRVEQCMCRGGSACTFYGKVAGFAEPEEPQ
jgi:hypothetical protein